MSQASPLSERLLEARFSAGYQLYLSPDPGITCKDQVVLTIHLAVVSWSDEVSHVLSGGLPWEVRLCSLGRDRPRYSGVLRLLGEVPALSLSQLSQMRGGSSKVTTRGFGASGTEPGHWATGSWQPLGLLQRWRLCLCAAGHAAPNKRNASCRGLSQTKP